VEQAGQHGRCLDCTEEIAQPPTSIYGLGDEFDPDKLEACPPGSVIVLPGNTSHFRWAKSNEYVTQVTAIGPLGLDYISAKDDPRNNK
jgi:hypothetical protein